MHKTFFLLLATCLLLRCQHEPIADTTACFSTGSEPLFEGKEIHFANCSLEGERYEWELGDGTTTEEPNPVHTYEKQGKYKVVLRTYAEDGYDMMLDSITINGFVLKSVFIRSVSIEEVEDQPCYGLAFVFGGEGPPAGDKYIHTPCNLEPGYLEVLPSFKVSPDPLVRVGMTHQYFDWYSLTYKTTTTTYYSKERLDLFEALTYKNVVIEDDRLSMVLDLEFATSDTKR